MSPPVATLINEPSNRSGAQVGTIHQTDAVQDSYCYYETAVNAMDDLSLLDLAELALVFTLGRAIDVLLLRIEVLLRIIVVVRRLETHGGLFQSIVGRSGVERESPTAR